MWAVGQGVRDQHPSGVRCMTHVQFSVVGPQLGVPSPMRRRGRDAKGQEQQRCEVSRGTTVPFSPTNSNANSWFLKTQTTVHILYIREYQPAHTQR